jgi:small subunit ribosomal protein S5
MSQSQSKRRRKKDLIEKVIRVARVSTKTKGGDSFGFSVMMVVGNGKGKVGVGVGKARDVVTAIRKGVKRARKKMVQIPIAGTTIPFQIRAKYGAGKVLLKPATEGTGVIAGGPVRAVMDAVGIKDISAKILGSDNQATSVLATMKGLKTIKKIVKVRGIDVEAAGKKYQGESQQAQQSAAKQSKKQSKKSAKQSTKEAKQSAKKAAKSDKKKSKKAQSDAKKSAKAEKKDKTKKRTKADKKAEADKAGKKEDKAKKTKSDSKQQKAAKKQDKSEAKQEKEKKQEKSD